MVAPMSPEVKMLLRLLDDGEWHDLEVMLQRLSATVPPGKALRRYLERATLRESREGPRKKPELSDEEKIASGQRTLANVAVNSMKKRYIEVMGTPEGRRVRRRPDIEVSLPPKFTADDDDDEPQSAGSPPLVPEGQFTADDEPQSAEPQPEPVRPERTEPAGYTCGECGFWVVNREQHEEFHRERDLPVETTPAVAFFSEGQVRAIVAEEVQQALDDFQRGMQNWLTHRFAALETLAQGLPRSNQDGRPSRDRKRQKLHWP